MNLSNDETRKNCWNPLQYRKFEAERNLPFYDLIDLISPKKDMVVTDLGCGTGKLTKVLHETFHPKKTIGIDSSPTMLEESFQYTMPGLEFKQMDIEELHFTDKFDLIFSNAALQWVPDHIELFSLMTSHLTKEGQLAIQMPANHDYPTHVIARELAGQSPFKEDLKGCDRPFHVLTIEEYSKLLYRLGFNRQIVRMQVYPHTLDSTQSLIEWVKGSLLTYYQSRLSPEKFDLFLELYSEKIHAFFGSDKPLFLPFKRILIWSQFITSSNVPNG